MTVELLEPHGFCAGVSAALAKAETSLAKADGRVYCLHELVHNEIVVRELRSRGMVFVESVEEVPEGATVLFSAHGVGPSVRARARERNLEILDATCPFVEKVHRAAGEFAKAGLPVVVIGKSGHAEVEGIVGEVKGAGGEVIVVAGPEEVGEIPGGRSAKFGVVAQTTMNADEVAETVGAIRRGREVAAMAEVCRATKLRQDAVKAFRARRKGERDAALLVLGSATSSNTRRLCEVAGPLKVFRAGTIEELAEMDFQDVGILGVTSGASTPETFFADAVKFLKTRR